jgi:ubiquinone biosynthesis protein
MLIVATTAPAVGAWIVLGPPAAFAVTVGAGRLLGARRSWFALSVAGVVGWTLGVVSAGVITGWQWDGLEMVLLALLLGTLFTMIAALGIDLLAPMGSLATGDQAGLFSLRNPLKSVRDALRPIRRYREVLHLARVNGVTTTRPDPATLPVGVRQTLEQAGGMLVKVGQVASTRADLLPAAWCDELALLRSHAEPAPAEAIRPVLEHELGTSVEDSFAHFNWDPIASASIAQVYEAELRDGTPVVIKVQRPGLETTIALDSAAIMQLAGLIERRTTLGLALRPRQLAAEFIDNVREELDFRLEAANVEAVHLALAGTDRVRVPAVFPALSTRSILAEERVSGHSVTDVEGLRSVGIDPSDVGRRLLDAFVTQVFDAGVFHSDPHPGNILVEADGTIVLIDLGAVGRLGPNQRTLVLQMLAGAAAGDATALRAALNEVMVIDSQVDLRRLDLDIDDMLARHLRPGGGITTAAFQDLTLLLGRYGMHLPRWFGVLSRTLVTLEGTLRSIDPSFSLVDAARARAGDVVFGRARPSSLRTALEQEAMTQLPRLQRLPERVDEFLGQAVSGQLSGRLALFSHEGDERLVRAMVDRLVLSVLAASVGIGSVLLLNVRAGPALSDTVTLNEVLGYLGLACSTVLVLRVIAGVVRDGVT